MDWIKIPTDSILYSEFKDAELITIIKYQALYCQLEKAPSESQMNRIFNKKELKLIQSYKEVVQELCENQIFSVTKKRNKDKENYKQKQTLEKNSASGTDSERSLSVGADKIREEKIRKEKKNNKKEIIEKFSDWWVEYPKKVSKADAEKVFEKILTDGRASFDELMDGVKRYSHHCRTENVENQYIKHPSTWLNQGCWTDEYETKPKHDFSWV